MEDMALRIADARNKNSTSWVLSSAAALYWRVKGNAEQAVICLRHSLYYAPNQMKDIPLISLSNILHRAGLYNDALIVTNHALEISPNLVVIHFTMANIYVSKVSSCLIVKLILWAMKIIHCYISLANARIMYFCFTERINYGDVVLRLNFKSAINL